MKRTLIVIIAIGVSIGISDFHVIDLTNSTNVLKLCGKVDASDCFDKHFATGAELDDVIVNRTYTTTTYIDVNGQRSGINSVNYFDKNNNIYRWYGDSIVQRHWRIVPLVYIFVLHYSIRKVTIYDYCDYSDDNEDNEDNEYACIIMSDVKLFFGDSGSQYNDKRNGDVFNLHKLKQAPFDLSIPALRRSGVDISRINETVANIGAK